MKNGRFVCPKHIGKKSHLLSTKRCQYTQKDTIYCSIIRNIYSVVVLGHEFSGHKDNHAVEKLATRIQKRSKDTALIVFN